MIELTEKSIFDILMARKEPKNLHEQIYRQVGGGLSSLFDVSHHTLIYRNKHTIILFFATFNKLCEELNVGANVACCGGPSFSGDCQIDSLEELVEAETYLRKHGLIE